MRIEAKVVHAHPPGGNGVSWWIEHRHDERADRLDADAIGSGQPAHIAPIELNVGPGSRLVLAVGSRGGDVNSDLTDVDLTVTELPIPAGGGTWARTAPVRSSQPIRIPIGWAIADVLAIRVGARPASGFLTVPPGSRLAAWHIAVLDNKPLEQLKELAERVQAVLVGDRPGPDREADRQLFDNLQSLHGPLLEDLDTSRWLGKPGEAARRRVRGLPGAKQFGPGSAGSPADENEPGHAAARTWSRSGFPRRFSRITNS